MVGCVEGQTSRLKPKTQKPKVKGGKGDQRRKKRSLELRRAKVRGKQDGYNETQERHRLTGTTMLYKYTCTWRSEENKE